ncbi:hypothetical protein BGS_0566 [Beggiatoa sp. SS]|nr:hypothetical protein BGS_0566 [Beggiatoa sp. SS]
MEEEDRNTLFQIKVLRETFASVKHIVYQFFVPHLFCQSIVFVINLFLQGLFVNP